MKQIKILIQQHADGYMAYPVGLKGGVDAPWLASAVGAAGAPMNRGTTNGAARRSPRNCTRKATCEA
jgi:hypothetical protein